MQVKTMGDMNTEWNSFDQLPDDDELRDSLIQEGRFNALPTFKRVRPSFTNCKIQGMKTKGLNQTPFSSQQSKTINKISYEKYSLFSSQQTLSLILPFLNLREILIIFEIFLSIESKMKDKDSINSNSYHNYSPKKIGVQSKSSKILTKLSPKKSSSSSSTCFEQEQLSPQIPSSDEIFHVRFGTIKRRLSDAIAIRLCKGNEDFRMIDSHRFFSSILKMNSLIKVFPLTFIANGKKKSVYEQDIIRDAERTFLDKKNSEKQICINQLVEILIGLSHSIPEIGYVQGWNMIAGSLIRCGFSSELSFWSMNFLMKQMKIKEIFINEFKQAHFLNYALAIFTKNYLSDLFAFMKTYELELSYFSISWFLSIFSVDLSPLAAIKVWILVCLKGWKYLMKIALSILTISKQKIMQCKDEEEINEFLKKSVGKHLQLHEKELFKVSQSIKVTNTLLSRLEQIYQREQSFSSDLQNIKLTQSQQQANSQIFIKQITITDKKKKTVLEFIKQSPQISIPQNNTKSSFDVQHSVESPSKKQQKRSLQSEVQLSSKMISSNSDLTSQQHTQKTQSTLPSISSSQQSNGNQQKKTGLIHNFVNLFDNKWTTSTKDKSTQIQSDINQILQQPRQQQMRSSVYSISPFKIAENNESSNNNQRRHTEIACDIRAEELMCDDDNYDYDNIFESINKDKTKITQVDSNTSINEDDDQSLSGFKENTQKEQNDKISIKKKENIPNKKNEDNSSKNEICSNNSPETQSFFQKILNIFKSKDQQQPEKPSSSPTFFGNKDTQEKSKILQQNQVSRSTRNKSHDISPKSSTILLTEPIARQSPLLITPSHSRQSSLAMCDLKQQKVTQSCSLSNHKQAFTKILPSHNKQNNPSHTSMKQQQFVENEEKNSSDYNEQIWKLQVSDQNKKESKKNYNSASISTHHLASKNVVYLKKHVHTASISHSISANLTPMQITPACNQLLQQNSSQQASIFSINTPKNNNNNKLLPHINSKTPLENQTSSINFLISRKCSASNGQDKEIINLSVGSYNSNEITNYPHQQQFLQFQNDNKKKQLNLEEVFSPLSEESVSTSDNIGICSSINRTPQRKMDTDIKESTIDGWENYNTSVTSENCSIEPPHTPPFFIHATQRTRDQQNRSSSSSQNSFPTFNSNNNNNNSQSISNHKSIFSTQPAKHERLPGIPNNESTLPINMIENNPNFKNTQNWNNCNTQSKKLDLSLKSSCIKTEYQSFRQSQQPNYLPNEKQQISSQEALKHAPIHVISQGFSNLTPKNNKKENQIQSGQNPWQK